MSLLFLLPLALCVSQALEQPVLQQLGEVVDQGLCVVYAGDASEDVPPKAGTTAAANSKCPSYFTSLQAFKQHVEQQHLVSGGRSAKAKGLAW